MPRPLDPTQWLRKAQQMLSLYRDNNAGRPVGVDDGDGALLLWSTDQDADEDTWTDCECTSASLGQWTKGTGYYRLVIPNAAKITTHYVSDDDRRRSTGRDDATGSTDAMRRYERDKWEGAQSDLYRLRDDLESERRATAAARSELASVKDELSQAKARIAVLESQHVAPLPSPWVPLIQEAVSVTRTVNETLVGALKQEQPKADERGAKWEQARAVWQDVCAAIIAVSLSPETLDEAARQCVLVVLGTDAEAEIVEQVRPKIVAILADVLDAPGEHVSHAAEVIETVRAMDACLDMDTYDRPINTGDAEPLDATAEPGKPSGAPVVMDAEFEDLT